jgi:glycine betaine/proline transport system substrate-binding protein
MKKLLSTCALALSIGGTSAMAADSCGDITIAEMNWASAGVLAQIDRLILEMGYDCSVELVAGDTGPTFASMAEKGQPDLAPEMWVHGVREALDQAGEEKRIIIASHPLIDGSQEGWWVPTYIAEKHGIRTVEDALANPQLFPGAEDSSKGALFNCPAGWNCQMVTENYFRAYDAGAKGFELVDCCLGGQRGRNLRFWPVGGRIQRRFMKDTRLIEEESAQRLATRKPKVAADVGDVQLF